MVMDIFTWGHLGFLNIVAEGPFDFLIGRIVPRVLGGMVTESRFPLILSFVRGPPWCI